ncbi:MAG: hypothetical protein VKK62_03395 [Synechococcaceae cyanobacterium]|nr:hypothetical protein [Synechococcaceae cyanobacterium]
MGFSPDPQHRSRTAGRGPSEPPVPWLPLLQVGIGSMLVVLFLVMLARTQEQSRTIERLDQRLQGLENTRALERTSAMEDQLRKMLSRMETIEASNRRLADMATTQESLLQQLQSLRRQASAGPDLLSPALPELPPPPRSTARPSPPAPAANPGILRPPGQEQEP